MEEIRLKDKKLIQEMMSGSKTGHLPEQINLPFYEKTLNFIKV
jgi:hypothetical protein